MADTLKQKQYKVFVDDDATYPMKPLSLGLYEKYQRLMVRSLAAAPSDRAIICSAMGWDEEKVKKEGQLTKLNHLVLTAELLLLGIDGKITDDNWTDLDMEVVNEINANFLRRSTGLDEML